jgi:subtilase family serine protease
MTFLNYKGLLGLLGIGLFAGLAWSQGHTAKVTIAGNTPRALSAASLVGHQDSNTVMDIVVGLKMRNEKELADLIARQSDPNSSDFQNFITPADFTRRFAPLQADVDKVTQHLESNGLTVTEVSHNHMLVHARGTVSQMEQAFSVSINRYELQGEHHFSNDRDPSVPAALGDVVQSVMGLSSMEKLKRASSQAAAQPLVSYTPPQIATAYSFPNANNAHPDGKIYSGKGVTLAIATAFGYNPTDVNFFWQYFGITRTGTITDMPISASMGSNPDPSETTADVEQSGAQAPDANMLVYIIPNVAFSTFITMYAQIAEDNTASVVSSSWGYCELVLSPASIQSAHAAFEQGAAQGISYFISSADSGAFACYPLSTSPAVAYPASDPYVTAVGGTTLFTGRDGLRASENAWEDTGGGASSIFARPIWQHGPGVPQDQNRDISDVAFDADLNTGYWTYLEGEWFSNTGGTSLGTPNWAALWALGVEAEGGHRTGLPNPFLYSLGQSVTYHSKFYDTRSGSNGCVVFDGCPGTGYSAGPNWDYPTGWGSPKGSNLVRSMQTTFGH